MLVIALGPTQQVLRTGTKIVGCTVSETDLMVASVPGMQIVPLHRVGLGISMLLDLQGSILSDLLGDDVAAPADAIAWLLGRGSGDGRTVRLAMDDFGTGPPAPLAGRRAPLGLVRRTAVPGG